MAAPPVTLPAESRQNVFDGKYIALFIVSVNKYQILIAYSKGPLSVLV